MRLAGMAFRRIDMSLSDFPISYSPRNLHSLRQLALRSQQATFAQNEWTLVVINKGRGRHNAMDHGSSVQQRQGTV